ncbi:related to Quinidine resistance protein 2 [Saccharomycodes ludwigii]|uniref:Related to Quinidine resistance protein 2 n=1 Tax=Saccharomycodes ludwigii TaxID=36035 RepID=A0A376BAQ4_9ASCO|nr:hypothetical protein SCDLUD_002800 [Saccharomycodes ludwigii]KAH3901309.1 hypothetical protein SCDLUD_002800 [Saccharomycodes ludwigii]SSD61763.1 related to Quinidine resistance protein 2 [Saccharomycodes ludwigii]
MNLTKNDCVLINFNNRPSQDVNNSQGQAEPSETNNMTNANPDSLISHGDETTQDITKTATSEYSAFSKNEKYVFVFLCASTAVFSTIAAPIYYPALRIIEQDFHIDEELVNVSVVVYFIFQGLSPTLVGAVADTYGRRPVVLTSLTIYFCACIGLARAKTYAQILVLRCLQSAGISPVIAVNNSIMGDIATSAERGGYVGLTSGFQVIGTAFGSLIGAGLTATWGWRSIFWFLTIGSGVSLLSASVFLPESKRSIVGNGSIVPKLLLNRAPILYFGSIGKKIKNPDYDTLEVNSPLKLLGFIDVFKRKELAILLWVSGIQFSCWTVHLTTLSSVLSSVYGLSTAKVGLCYLPAGICTLLSVVSAGRLLNWNYKRRMSKYKEWAHNNENIIDSSLPEHRFNIYKTRLELAFIPIILSAIGFITAGWLMTYKVNLGAVLVFSGFACLFCNCILTFTNTLMVDLYPGKSSIASGCVNFSRCILSAILIAALSKMLEKMKPGGTFTFISGLATLSSVLLMITIKRGPYWEYKRNLKNPNFKSVNGAEVTEKEQVKEEEIEKK